MRYKINKIGFLNYWLYDEEEFHFYDGKLLLRGSNGTGKSVTMVSVLPLLFDGNKNPERFDTFGSRDRKIEEYVLAQDSDATESTSYIYMEFFRSDINKYITIGIGLKAVRNRNVDFWGFALTDNRRIKNGFSLYKSHLNKVPLTKRECQIEVGTGGEFVTTIKDYKNMVNRLLFGFETDSMYTELINLMLQLRSPKLSKEYRPTKLEDILSGVLEPISEADIQKISDSIENMNRYKENIEDLTEENRILGLLKNSFYDYSDNVLYAKAKSYIEAKNNLKKKENEALLLDENIQNMTKDIDNYSIEQEEIKLRLTDLNVRINELSLQDVNSLIDSLNTYKERYQEFKDRLQKTEENLNNKKENLEQKTNDISLKEDELYILEKEYNDKLLDLKTNITMSNFDDLINLDISIDSLKELGNIITTKKALIEEIKIKATEKEKAERSKNLLEDDMARENVKLNNYGLKANEITQKVIAEINNLVDNFYAMQNNKVFVIETDLIEEIKNILKKMNYDVKAEIKDLLSKRYFAYKEDLARALNLLDKKKIKELQRKDELENTKNNLINVFENNIDDTERKEYAKSLGVNANYLYELIDFKENVSIVEKKNLENALRAMGILQTLVIKGSKNMPKTFGNLKKVNDSILQYFDITDTNYETEVKEILESISISDGNVFVNADGTYRIGIIEGNSISDYDLKYIGNVTREKYIQKLTKDIDDALLVVDEELTKINNDYNTTLESIDILNKEYNADINLNTFISLINDLKSMEQVITNTKELITSKEKDIALIGDRINKYNREILSIMKDYNGGISLSDLDATTTILNDLLVDTNYILTLSNNKDKVNGMIDILKSTVSDLEYDLDNIRVELGQIQANINNIEKQIASINAELEQDKYKNVLEILDNLKEEQNSLNKRREELIELNAKMKTELEHQKENLGKMQKEIKDDTIINKVLYDVFMLEYNLGYSRNQNLEDDVDKWFKNYKIDKIRNLNDASDNFNDRINDHAFKLQNYAGRKVYPFDNLESDAEKYTTDEELLKVVQEILINAKRTDLEFRGKNGKNVNILELSKTIEEELERNRNLLNEEDRKLFEDLLLNNVGDSIREKIRSSKKWVEDVKRIMEKMNTSSGLTFSLSWQGKTKDTEQELDTNEVVNIFNADAQILSEEDSKKIVAHFRSKIALEEEKYDDAEINYIEVIKSVLDYRKWFQFKLYFKRAGGEKRELTDKEFSKFSGGEKAIAMYIPLFAGINAKFNAARSDAPRVIALDEAFAGVDDANIEDSFRILEELDLDYILTSQILWGDYHTVKSLAISELHHLPGSDVISIMRFKWDGVKRCLVTNESEYGN